MGIALSDNTGVKKGIALIFTANLINAVFTILTNFLLPKYLTIDSYSVLKSYQLYLSYVGILHLGYSDGVYLKYGGKVLRDISPIELAEDVSTFRLFQIIVSFVCIVISLFLQDSAFTACALAIIPYNISNYYRSVFQAIGEFKKYSRVMNATVVLTFVANAVLLLLRVFSSPVLYLALYLLVNITIWIILEIVAYKASMVDIKSFVFSFKFSCLKENIKNGFFLMLGTFSSIFLTGMDRLFIKALMDNTAFAMYSFAVSLEGIMSIVTSAISATLFNYFCNHKEQRNIRKVKGYLFVISLVIISCAFPAKAIIQLFIPQYTDSISALFILFSAQLFFIIAKAVYVNVYKAFKKQNEYFTKLVIVIISGAIFNTVLYIIMKTKEAFAIGTLLSAFLWVLLSIKDFPDKETDLKYCAISIFAVCIQIILGIFVNVYIGFVVYILFISIICLSLLKKETISLIRMIKTSLNVNTRHAS